MMSFILETLLITKPIGLLLANPTKSHDNNNYHVTQFLLLRLSRYLLA